MTTVDSWNAAAFVGPTYPTEPVPPLPPMRRVTPETPPPMRPVIPPLPPMRPVTPETPPPVPEPTAASSPALSPGVQPPAEGGLRKIRPPARARLYLVGAHGGAGESTWAELLPGSSAMDHCWPDVPGAPVVLLARTGARDLLATQRVLQQWRSGHTPHITLLGLILAEDIPGKQPRELADMERIVRGAAPRDHRGREQVWRLPYIKSWRLGALDRPPEVTRVLDAIGRVAALPSPTP